MQSSGKLAKICDLTNFHKMYQNVYLPYFVIQFIIFYCSFQLFFSMSRRTKDRTAGVKKMKSKTAKTTANTPKSTASNARETSSDDADSIASLESIDEIHSPVNYVSEDEDETATVNVSQINTPQMATQMAT